jgi:cation diffusion facilitator family transporter
VYTFIKKKDKTLKEQLNRQKIIIKTSTIGIITNIILSAFKLFIGMLSSSIAIMMDAVNNLSDALSSIITIIGMKLSAKPADSEHPLGHGRIEYLSAMAVSFIVFFAGITSLYESIKKAINPTESTYSTITLIIIIVGIITKIILGHYTKGKGTQVNSTSLIASGSDALFDAIVSASTLFSAIITILFKINIDGYVGAAISLVIIKAGWELLSDTLNDILGSRVDSTLTKSIKEDIKLNPEIIGVYDLILHNYGPEILIGSVHIEVKETLDAKQIYDITRKLRLDLYYKYGVLLTFGIYAANTRNPEVSELQGKISKYVTSIDGIIQIHAFYVDFDTNQMSFDVVIDFKVKDKFALRDSILAHLKEEYPNFSDIFIAVDTLITD